jgi:hypothetical protein
MEDFYTKKSENPAIFLYKMLLDFLLLEIHLGSLESSNGLFERGWNTQMA